MPFPSSKKCSRPTDPARWREIARRGCTTLLLLIGSLHTAIVLHAQSVHSSVLFEEPPARYDTDMPSAEFHRGRREAVLESLPPNSIAVLFSAAQRYRQGDVDFEYRQANDLYYLTGATEPGTVLVLAPGGFQIDGTETKELLLVPPRDLGHEVWNGRRLGAERATRELGIDVARGYQEFERVVDTLLAEGDKVVYHLPLPSDLDPGSVLGRQVAYFSERVSPLSPPPDAGARFFLESIAGVDDPETFRDLKARAEQQDAHVDPGPDARVRSMFEAFERVDALESWRRWRQINLPNADDVALRRVLDGLREVKTEEEIAQLQRAIDITAAAHIEAMKSIEPGMFEYEVEAVIEYLFKRNGAAYPGFPSIIASGENSVILHYATNRRQMEAGDLVVMDVGAEYHGYSADVTRTVPVSGSFSPEQRTLYDLVLEAQDAAIAACRPGASSGAPHQAASRVLARGLSEQGLIENAEDWRGLRRFFMHGTSHALGLDVHDVSVGRVLTAGNVITIEPGLYITPSVDIDPRWWNIGIRIEDDILISENGPVVMSASAPRRAVEIEAVMRLSGLGNQPAGDL